MASSYMLVLLLAFQLAAASRHEYKGHTVHVVFSNHLDVGFTDLDSKVIDLYFHRHLPHAARLAHEVQSSPNNTHGDSFRYLSHSWLLSLFLDCPPNMGWTCPNETEVSLVTEAIEQGTITWHAAPFNPQYEVFDSSLLRFAVDLTHTLDDRFGQQHKRMASLRDVPGMTRASIPVLSGLGVKAVSSGVNGFSAPPGVPKTTPFIWLDEQTGSQLLYMVHPGGYAGVRADGLHIDSHHDCIRAPGLKHVLCASWGDDNLGPPADADQVLAMFHHVRRQWPGACVVGSTLEDYLEGLMGALAQGGLTLPVVTGEVGDTWIHGIASDPGRMADYRAVLRARKDCELTADCDSQSAAYFNFSRLLLKIPEHTWGVSFNQYFGDFSNYTNAWLHQHLSEGEEAHPGLALSVESWRRQRRYIDWALEALPPTHPIVAAVVADRSARKALSSITPEDIKAARDLHDSQADVSHATIDSSDAADRASGSAARAPGGSAARCAAVLAAVDESAARKDDDLLFCSKHWLIQVDKHTGGLTRVQRVYGEGEGARLGNDWAAGRGHSHTCCSTGTGSQQPPELQQQPAPAAAATWVQRAALWLLQHSSSMAAWLPSPGRAAADADFAVGDEAEHSFRVATAAAAAGRGAAEASSTSARGQGTTGEGRVDQSSTPSATAGAGASSTAVYRRLLSLQGLWSGASTHNEKSVSSSSSNSKAVHGATVFTGPSAGAAAKRCACGRGSAFAELQYNVYNLQDYDPVWEHYAYLSPFWIGDFGKNNLSASSNMSDVARPRLVAVYDEAPRDDTDGLQLHLELTFPHKLVKHAGAPGRAWLSLQSAADLTRLDVTLVWQNKTATRLPEALWLRFKPGKGGVDEGSWLMHKLDGAISPAELVLNGSHSLHSISQGVSVSNRAGNERLTISSLDVPLVNLGAPNPLPNPCDGPDMREGVSFNPVNNIWGTNYAMWVPFIPSDANMAFRFALEVTQPPMQYPQEATVLYSSS